MSVATLTTKGQVTIPKDVRDALGVGPGDKVDFVRMEDGNFAVLPASQSVKKLKGILKKPVTPVTLEAMDRAIVEGSRRA